MNPTPPDRSLTQRLNALERAQEVRIFRARLKDKIRDADPKETGIAEAAWQIADPHPLVQSMKIQALLLAVPKIGRQKAGRILLVCGISPTKTLGGLTDRQRLELVCQLGLLPPEAVRARDESLIRKLKAVS